MTEIKEFSVLMRRFDLLIVVVLIFTTGGGLTPDALAQDYLNLLTLTHGIWAETDLPDYPGNVVSGDLDFEDSYYVGLICARTLVDDFSIPIPFTEIRFSFKPTLRWR
jgi:hypothetical protein